MFSQFTNLYFPVCSLIVNSFLNILYFKKRRINNKETGIYKKLLIIGLIESIVMFVTNLLVCLVFNEISNVYFEILNKVLYCIYIIWLSYMGLYVYTIGNPKEKNEKLIKIINMLISTIFCVLIMVTPIKLYYQNGFTNSYGVASNMLYIGCAIYLTIASIFLIMDIKEQKQKKKYFPLYILLLLMVIMMIIRKYDPLLNISSNVFSIVLLIMYFTIENPDVKLIETLQKNREIVDRTIEDKANMLFKISEDVKTPVKKIEILSSRIVKNNEIKEMHDDASIILTLSRDVKNTINNVLDISNYDISNIKVSDMSYDIYNIFSELVIICKQRITKEIDFKYHISSSVPNKLYGDPVKFKQIIFTIIENAIMNTEKGTIDLNISSINRGNVSRLIIEISDTGIGMNAYKINEILESDEDSLIEENKKIENLDTGLKVVKKIIDILGGQLLIKSNEKEGSTFTIIYNQVIVSDSEAERYNVSSLSNKKTALVLCDNYVELEKMAFELKKNSLITTTSLYGMDLISKINNNEKFDYIFIDDEMKPNDAVEIIKKVNGKFNIIIMLNKNKESIKNHYLEDYGFSDYLLKDSYKEEIKRIISKK